MYRYLPGVKDSATLPPLQTFDLDWTLPNPLERKGELLHDRLINFDFVPVLERTQPHLGRYQPARYDKTLGPIHIEFLTPRKGSSEVHGRKMTVPTVQQELNAQALPYLGLLLYSPLTFDASVVPHSGLDKKTSVLLPGPMAFVLQKTLARKNRPTNKKSSDQAHIYDAVALWHNQWSALSAELQALEGATFPKIWFKRVRNELVRLYSSPHADGPVEVASAYRDSATTPRLHEKTVHRAMQRFLRAIRWQI